MIDVFTPDFWLYTGNKAIRIVGIMLGAWFTLRFLRMVVDRFFIANAGIKATYFEGKRARTLSSLLKSITSYTIYFIALVMILQEFKIDTTSIIAGAGVVGLALGVGAQSLIRDIITGFFIILEDQYAVGDYIVSGDMAGIVEDMGFRVTRLRDSNGVLHIIPNGAISRISNHTRGSMQAVVNIPVAYDADFATVMALLEEACAKVKQTNLEIVEGPKVVGIVDFGSHNMVIRLTAKTLPLEQFKVETAIRQEVKLLFDAANILPPAQARASQ